MISVKSDDIRDCDDISQYSIYNDLIYVFLKKLDLTLTINLLGFTLYRQTQLLGQL